jgi:hypothetical protein
MNPKILFLLYGVIVIGSSYRTISQILATLKNDITASENTGCEKETISHIIQFNPEHLENKIPGAAEDVAGHSRAPA